MLSSRDENEVMECNKCNTALLEDEKGSLLQLSWESYQTPVHSAQHACSWFIYMPSFRLDSAVCLLLQAWRFSRGIFLYFCLPVSERSTAVYPVKQRMIKPHTLLTSFPCGCLLNSVPIVNEKGKSGHLGSSECSCRIWVCVGICSKDRW